jgi:hypothetical protein
MCVDARPYQRLRFSRIDLSVRANCTRARLAHSGFQRVTWKFPLGDEANAGQSIWRYGLDDDVVIEALKLGRRKSITSAFVTGLRCSLNAAFREATRCCVQSVFQTTPA